MAIKNTKIKINQENVEVDLPFVTPTNKYVIVVDPATNEMGKSVLTAGGGIAFNGERPINSTVLPQLNGIVLHGATSTQILANLLPYLYETVLPSCLLIAGNSDREYGDTNAVTLYYNAYAGDLALDAIYVNGVSIDLDITQGATTASTAPNTTTTFNMVVVDDEAHQAVSYATVTYHHNRFWFQSATNLFGLSEADLSDALQNTNNKEYSSSKAQDRNFTLANEYIYFAYPTSFGTASFVVGGLPNTAYTSTTFNYMNPYGYIEPYILYKSGGRGTGSINVKVQ